jgi:hypothetical protein
MPLPKDFQTFKTIRKGKYTCICGFARPREQLNKWCKNLPNNKIIATAKRYLHCLSISAPVILWIPKHNSAPFCAVCYVDFLKMWTRAATNSFPMPCGEVKVGHVSPVAQWFRSARRKKKHRVAFYTSAVNITVSETCSMNILVSRATRLQCIIVSAMYRLEAERRELARQ